MCDVFPELKQHEARIGDIIAAEEASFGKTLVKGIEKFKKAAQDVQGRVLSGQDAFILWDTYGFPLDLTQLMAEERGLVVDVEGFNNAMDEAREKSRSARNKQAGGAIVMDADATSALHKKGVYTTDDSFKFIWFKDHESAIKAIYTGSEFVESASTGDDIGIVLESTSFYAEQGGQCHALHSAANFKCIGYVCDQEIYDLIFDTGSLDGPFGSFQVCNVQIFGGFVLHIGSLSGVTGKFSVGDKVTCKVDYDRRALIAPNHTCTHMLNYALREVLGNHVDQKGSIVLPEKLRFDFSHDVYSKEATLAEAKRINGLRAVFGEVYPDPVRVVAIGKKVEDLLADPENKEWSSISSELCGGTHITNTREARAFALLSEEGIAKGVRRITAVTTESALKAMELGEQLLKEVDDASKLEVSLLEKVCMP
ncbi:Alanine--tRNA ligase [Hibiscus syriacus]|uniref:alanine--tRNA ligase n=1 Tax=Hibiscus syriacus TaxID=106335 RepID=A0A6A2WYL1_HIBSY|nr:Alanine--tRNA ligase [Hibiscus syriacus]